MTTINNQSFKEIGFLLPVPEQQNATAVIHLKLPHLTNRWTIQKQSGLPATSYSITQNAQTQNIILDADTQLDF